MSDWRSIVEPDEPVVVLQGRRALEPAAYARYYKQRGLSGRQRLREGLRRFGSFAFSMVLHLLAVILLMEMLYIAAPQVFETTVTVSLRPSTRPPGGGVEAKKEDAAPPAAKAAETPKSAETAPTGVVGGGGEGRAAEPSVLPVFDSIEPLPASETQGFPGGALIGDRGAAGRRAGVGRHGGDAGSEAAVELGLKWLSEHQMEDGRWSPQHYLKRCPAKSPCGALMMNEPYSPGVTALTLLAFLGAGYTQQEGKYKETVDRGLKYLVGRQESSGQIAGSSMYDHGVATLALGEAMAMTRDERLRAPLERAVALIERSQRAAGGWSYPPDPEKGQDEFTLSVWQMMGLKAAATAGVPVSGAAVDRFRRYLRTSTRRDGGVDYRQGRPTPGSTAAALFARCLVSDPGDGDFERGLEWLDRHGITIPSLKSDPGWARLYSAYYRTLVQFQLQGDAWRSWNRGMKEHLVGRQQTKGHAAGTWPEMDAAMGGRPGATAMAVLMLEVYYRYLPMMTDRSPLGAVAGAVDSESARELAVLEATTPDYLRDRAKALEDLKSPEPSRRFQGARTLARLKDRSALPAMMAAAEREEGPLRGAQLRAIGEVGGAEAVEFLRRFLADPEESVRQAAADAIRMSGQRTADR